MKMTLQMEPLTLAERLYAQPQSCQIAGQAGLVGWLDMDLGSKTPGTAAWHKERTYLQTPAFQAEFDSLMEKLRGEGGPLYDRQNLDLFCRALAPQAAFPGDGQVYGVRMETETHTCLFRLAPLQQENTVRCFCYQRALLRSHMRCAEQGIRFIDTHYTEQFRIPDGDKVRLLRADGSSVDRVCRYIDECHLELGDSLYHCLELAERLQRAEAQVIPLRSSLPEQCYGLDADGDELLVLRRGKKGCSRTGKHGHDHAAAQAMADKYNRRAGVNRAQAAAMLAGALEGWAAPAADPARYDEQGQPLPARGRVRGYAR